MNKLFKFTVIAVFAGVLFSCENMMDVHQEFIEGGEIVYAPKVDSLVFRNGKGRVQLWFWLLESPNVRSVDIFWNNYADSLIVPVTPSALRDSMMVYVPLKDERSYTFYVRTTDIFGNHSLSLFASATSYDSIYASVLVNRSIKSAITEGSTTTIQWYGIADDYVCSEVRYTDVNNEVQIVRVLPNETSTSISDAKEGSTYEYRSLYVPANCIDPFYTEWTPIVPTAPPTWISQLPEGRYRSTLLATNGENNQHGYWRVYKYIMRISNDPQYANQYVVWGTARWSAEWAGRHGLGWMYNRLSLNNEADMTYNLEPIVGGNDWPGSTFTYTGNRQQLTTNSKYDPATKTLTLYYKNDPDGGNPTDVLTYVGDEEVYGPSYTQWTWPPVGDDGNSILNWGQARSSGYKWWLPTD